MTHECVNVSVCISAFYVLTNNNNIIIIVNFYNVCILSNLCSDVNLQ